jgi:nucleotide-binding universal stress UspA family protein
MYKKALVPLDGSDLAEYALSQVISLVEEGSVGEVTLLNVVKFDLPRVDEYPEHVDINAIREPLFVASKKYLAEAESRLSTKGIKVKTESIEANKPANAIRDYAEKNDMDLIVMSTHGYTGLKKLLLGCVGSDVLNRSSVPVLLIRAKVSRLGPRTVRHWFRRERVDAQPRPSLSPG